MSQDRITCDDCGTLNPPNLAQCELCGESLHEEQERAERGNLAILVFFAVCLTALCFALPAVGIFMYLTQWKELDLSPGLFGAMYLGAWFILGLISTRYEPKSDYDFGWDMGYMGYMNNPFSLRDDIDRSHAMVGFILFPVHLVVGSWRAVWHRMR